MLVFFFLGGIFTFASFIFGFARFLGLLDLGIPVWMPRKLPGKCCSVMICGFGFLPISLFVILERGPWAQRAPTGWVWVQPKKPVY